MRRLSTILAVLVFCGSGLADEGLWLFNAVPKDKIRARYKFEVTDVWLDHLRESSVRFNNGGSGSFVSADRLAFTNNHVASDCLSKVSTPAHFERATVDARTGALMRYTDTGLVVTYHVSRVDSTRYNAR